MGYRTYLLFLVIYASLLWPGAPLSYGDGESFKMCISRRLLATTHALWTEAKFWSPITFFDAFRGGFGLKHGMGMPVTRRGVIRYLWALHLLNYDFSGKRILDVGAGESEFVPWVNRYYGDFGTTAVAVDLAASRGFTKDNFAKADARKLPFADNTFDLTTTSWFLNNLSRSFMSIPVTAKSEAAAKARLEILRNSILEMIRVTKPGGEIRIYRTMFELLKTDSKSVLEGNPKIESIDYTPPGLMNGCIRIKIKKPR